MRHAMQRNQFINDYNLERIRYLLIFPLFLPVVGACVRVQAVPSLEVFLTINAWIARRFYVGFAVFLHILPYGITVATNMTDVAPLGNASHQ